MGEGKLLNLSKIGKCRFIMTIMLTKISDAVTKRNTASNCDQAIFWRDRDRVIALREDLVNSTTVNCRL